MFSRLCQHHFLYCMAVAGGKVDSTERCCKLAGNDYLGNDYLCLLKISSSMIKPTKWPVHHKNSDQPGQPPLLCAQWEAKDPKFLHAESEVWVDAQADPSLRWAHRSFCWFCCAAAQMFWQWLVSHVKNAPLILTLENRFSQTTFTVFNVYSYLFCK